jgi:hypothetical protein
MPDNVDISPGSSTPDPLKVSTDLGGSGYHVQRMKIAYSADGSEAHAQVDADGQLVNLGANNDVTIATLPSLPAGTNNIGDVDVLTLPALPAGTNAIGKLAANSGIDIGDVDVTSVIPGTAATNLGKAVDSVAGATDTGVAGLYVREDALTGLTPAAGDYSRGKVDQYGAQWTQLAGALDASIDSIAQDARAGTGADIYTNLDLDQTKVQIKGSAGTVYGWAFFNRTTAPIYVKLFNALSASVTIGTTAATMTLEVPGSTANHIGELVMSGLGLKFGTGITIACTTGFATADTADPGANGCIANVFYK